MSRERGGTAWSEQLPPMPPDGLECSLERMLCQAVELAAAPSDGEENGDALAALLDAPWPEEQGGGCVRDAIQRLTLAVGEKVEPRRMRRLSVGSGAQNGDAGSSHGIVAGYVHAGSGSR